MGKVTGGKTTRTSIMENTGGATPACRKLRQFGNSNPFLTAADQPMPRPASCALAIFPMRRAGAATSSVAPAIARFNTVMLAPRVTVTLILITDY